MDRIHLNQKHMKKCKLFARVCSQKVFEMFTICTVTLSSLVNCSVNNVLLEIGIYRN